MNIKTTLKTSVAAAALFAVAAPVAEAGNVSNGNKNSLTMSGQIVRQLMWADNGEDSELFHTDGLTTRSRIRWIAKGNLTESVGVSTLIEMNTPITNSPGNATIGANGPASGDTGAWAIRHFDIKFSHKSAGSFSIGQGNAAANGNRETSYAMSGAIHSASVGALNNGLVFFDDDATKAYSTVTAGAVMSNLDFSSRNDRIRYDAPSFGGLKLSASLTQGQQPEIGARWSGSFGGIKAQVRAGWNNTSGTSTTAEGIWGVSGAIMHDSGLQASASYGERDMKATATDDVKSWHVAAGYNAKLFALGPTGFDVHYAETESLRINDEDASGLTFSVVQRFSNIGSEIYAAYNIVDVDSPASAGVDYDNISILAAGTRVTF